MNTPPKWFKPVAIAAFIWNLLGCLAYLSDVMLTPEDIAAMSEAEQALYTARPTWAVGATAIAVWGGALGCLGLILRKSWANLVLMLSLAGVVVQDIALFGMSNAAAMAGPVVYVMQGVVLLVAIGLVLLSRKALKLGWIS